MVQFEGMVVVSKSFSYDQSVSRPIVAVLAQLSIIADGQIAWQRRP